MYRLIIFLFVFISFSATTHISDSQQNELLSVLPDDKYLGNLEAPVLVIEYAGLTCYHCSLFHKDVFPAIKKKYIDTGKILYVFRHFPLDYSGLKAAMLSLCYEKKEDFFNFNAAVFNLIDSWNYSNQKDLTLLHGIAKISNLGEEKFEQCINDESIMNKIVNSKLLAINKLAISGTPVYFIKINDNKESIGYDKFKHEGYRTLNYLSDVIEDLYTKATENTH